MSQRIVSSLMFLLVPLLCGCSGTGVTDVQTSPGHAESRQVRIQGTPEPLKLEDLNEWIGQTAVLAGDVSFKPGEAAITIQGRAILTELVTQIEGTPQQIHIEGFADGVIDPDIDNEQLSLQRADAVRATIIEIDPTLETVLLPPVGYGARGEVGGRKAVNGVPDELRRVVRITIKAKER